MSLLVDALKKAAEQKAAKSRQAAANRQASEAASASPGTVPQSGAPIRQTRTDDTVLEDLKLDQTQVRQVTGEDDGAREDAELTAAELDQTGPEHNFTNDENDSDDTELISGVYDQAQGLQPPSRNGATG